jgi:N-acetylmuramoyl-L-alanine amidase
MMDYLKKLVACSLLAFCSCASKAPYSATNKVYKKQAQKFARTLAAQPELTINDSIKAPEYFVGTTNFSLRKPNFVIIHHTDQKSCDQTLQTFTLPRTEVSSHYVICKDGTVHHMLNDYLRAHHAGIGKWGNVTDMNSCSIGIELDNDATEPFPKEQIASLISLLGQLKRQYNIPTANFIGHADFAPSRKQDPSILFPWKELARHGFGLWYDEPLRDSLPEFNYLTALRVIGYDTKDSSAAITAFKRHFMQDKGHGMTETDKRVLYSLMQKY